MATVEQFTNGKVPERNEDSFGHNDHRFVLADGATDKSGRTYGGKTGGELVSELIVRRALETELVGKEFVDDINTQLAELYSSVGIANEVADPKYRFSSTCILVHVGDSEISITVVGDSGFRINGSEVHQDFKHVDVQNAEARSLFISEHLTSSGITEELQQQARQHILPLLVKQFEYQNNPTHKLGYGAMDGSTTPEKFIRTLHLPEGAVQTIELFSDGYPATPTNEITIEAWEEAYALANKEDPYRYKKYKSTKTRDDRTVVIIRF